MSLLNNTKVHLFIFIVTVVYYFILKKYNKSKNSLLLSLYIPFTIYSFIYIISNTQIITDNVSNITNTPPLIDISEIYPTSNSI